MKVDTTDPNTARAVAKAAGVSVATVFRAVRACRDRDKITETWPEFKERYLAGFYTISYANLSILANSPELTAIVRDCANRHNPPPNLNNLIRYLLTDDEDQAAEFKKLEKLLTQALKLSEKLEAEQTTGAIKEALEALDSHGESSE